MRRKYPISRFGGLDQSRPQHEIEMNFTPDCSGVWSRYGRIARIHGKEKQSATQLAGSSVMQIYAWVDGSQNEYEIVISNTKTYKKDSTSYTSIQGSTDFTGSIDNPIATCGFFDSTASEILVVSNLIDGMYAWTGSGDIATLAGSPPKAQILLSFKGHLLAGIVDESGTVDWRKIRYSALYNAESWPAGNYFLLKRSTDALVSMNSMRDRVAIYKQKSISLLDYVGGSLVFDLTENYINGVGPASFAAVVEWGQHGERHFFIGRDTRAYEFDGIDHYHISKQIDPILRNINPTYKDRISGTYLLEESKIIWAVPHSDDATCKTLIIYDPLERSWWVKYSEAIAISCMGKSSITDSLTWEDLPYGSWEEWTGTWDDTAQSLNAPATLMGHADGYVRKFVEGVDDDSNVLLAYYYTPFDNLDGRSDTIKLITKIYIEIKTSTADPIRLEVFTDSNYDNPVPINDDGDTYASVANTTGDISEEYYLAAVDVVVQGKNIACKITNYQEPFEGGVASYDAWSAKIKGFDYRVIGADYNTELETESLGSEGLDYELDFEL